MQKTESTPSLLYGSILEAVNSYITVLGVITTAFASVVVLDYYFVSKRVAAPGADIAPMNRAGVTTVVGTSALSHFVLSAYIPVQFAVTLVLCAVFYPALRLTVLKPAASI